MKYNTFLIKYGELTTKGKNKSIFINTLVSLISTKLKGFSNTKMKTASDRIFIDFDENDFERLLEKLQEVFGIWSISLVKRSSLDIDEISAAVVSLIKSEDLGSYKVKARRRNKNYFMNSDQINRYVAGKIFENYKDAKVEIKKPKLAINIEIREDESYIYFKEVSGIKGLPTGTNGKAMVLLSGGIDSPVSAYLTMKKGLKLNAITFTSKPYTSPKALEKVLDLAKIVSKYNNDLIRVHEVSFTQIQQFLLKNTPERVFMTMQRRSMFRISEQIAKKFKHQALVSGESLGQVASQTIESMNAIHSSIDMMCLQPLLSYDKYEIIKIAQQIKTFDISIKPYEDSCTVFLPNNVSTKPNLEKILYYESKIIEQLKELENQAVLNLETHKLNANESNLDKFADLI